MTHHTQQPLGSLTRTGRRAMVRRLLGTVVLTVLTSTSLVVLAPQAQAATAITMHGAPMKAALDLGKADSVTVRAPDHAQAGDVVVALLALSRPGGSEAPMALTPAGWTVVIRATHGTESSLIAYTHPFVTGETSYTFSGTGSAGAVVLVAAYDGVDVSDPVDDAAVADYAAAAGRQFAAPSVTSAAPGEMLVAAYAGFTDTKTDTGWAPKSGLAKAAEQRNPSSRVSLGQHQGIQAAAGPSGDKIAEASKPQDDVLTALLGLRPEPAAPVAPVVKDVASKASGPGAVTVTWNTDVPADSQVLYGADKTYGSASSLDPARTTQHAVTLTGLKPSTAYHYAVASATSPTTRTVSPDKSVTTSNQQPSGGGPVPLIVDTDLFSDADDVGAIATAFGLQQLGEARVIAITLNTRTSRPLVTRDSWRCASALTRFYGADAVPIGVSTAPEGTEVNTVDFIGPCATSAPPNAPAPESAVTVMRRALAAQQDHSVRIASTGYAQNLAALLDSPADGVSSQTGMQLVTRKVDSLVIMGGGYPSSPGENNLRGNVPAAQTMASRWPTTVVWVGVEVGDEVRTGQTISSVHAANSPVRLAYEAFVRPGNYIYSYDLAAVLQAVRPTNGAMVRSQPGTNVVAASGANQFTYGASGAQYYVRLLDPDAVDAAIEALLDTLPPNRVPAKLGTPTVSGVADTGATVSWTSNEPTTGAVEFGATTAYGTTTTATASGLSHSKPVTGLTAGATYHYRVRATDADSNLTLSGDRTFTTSGAVPVLPNDDFSAATLGSLWTTSGTSDVRVEGGELHIVHPGGDWTVGELRSAQPYALTGRATALTLRRPANDGLGGATFGETSVFLDTGDGRSVEFFIGGGALTAWVNDGSGSVNLTPGWPAYRLPDAGRLRFRESAGTLFWEYQAESAPADSWIMLASTATPFPLDSVRFRVVAGCNAVLADVARVDNVTTS